jgi:hypothetical protein
MHVTTQSQACLHANNRNKGDTKYEQNKERDKKSRDKIEIVRLRINRSPAKDFRFEFIYKITQHQNIFMF